jgi:hypothetical protein
MRVVLCAKNHVDLSARLEANGHTVLLVGGRELDDYLGSDAGLVVADLDQGDVLPALERALERAPDCGARLCALASLDTQQLSRVQRFVARSGAIVFTKPIDPNLLLTRLQTLGEDGRVSMPPRRSAPPPWIAPGPGASAPLSLQSASLDNDALDRSADAIRSNRDERSPDSSPPASSRRDSVIPSSGGSFPSSTLPPPGFRENQPVGGVGLPTQISAELVRLLQDAENRVDASRVAAERDLSPAEELDALLPREFLSALDVSLELSAPPAELKSSSRTGDSRTGDSRTGDSRTGEPRAGEPRAGDRPRAAGDRRSASSTINDDADEIETDGGGRSTTGGQGHDRSTGVTGPDTRVRKEREQRAAAKREGVDEDGSLIGETTGAGVQKRRSLGAEDRSGGHPGTNVGTNAGSQGGGHAGNETTGAHPPRVAPSEQSKRSQCNAETGADLIDTNGDQSDGGADTNGSAPASIPPSDRFVHYASNLQSPGSHQDLARAAVIASKAKRAEVSSRVSIDAKDHAIRTAPLPEPLPQGGSEVRAEQLVQGAISLRGRAIASADDSHVDELGSVAETGDHFHAAYTDQVTLLEVITNHIAGAKTGYISLIDHETKTERVISVSSGDLLGVASLSPHDSVLSYLAERGDISKNAAAKLQKRVPNFGRFAGAALIAKGILGNNDMWPTLRGHATWVLMRAIHSESGSWSFTVQPDSDLANRLAGEPSVFGGSSGPSVLHEVFKRGVNYEKATLLLGGLGSRLAEGRRLNLISDFGVAEEDARSIRAHFGLTLSDLQRAMRSNEVLVSILALKLAGVVEVIPSAQPADAKGGPSYVENARIDEEAKRARIMARLAIVEEGDYFSLLGLAPSANAYEVRRAFVELRREFEPSRMLTANLLDLREELDHIVEVLEEAYDILRDDTRRERYRVAIMANQ